jgi:hypothetical protein
LKTAAEAVAVTRAPTHPDTDTTSRTTPLSSPTSDQRVTDAANADDETDVSGHSYSISEVMPHAGVTLLALARTIIPVPEPYGIDTYWFADYLANRFRDGSESPSRLIDLARAIDRASRAGYGGLAFVDLLDAEQEQLLDDLLDESNAVEDSPIAPDQYALLRAIPTNFAPDLVSEFFRGPRGWAIVGRPSALGECGTVYGYADPPKTMRFE